MDCTYNYMVKRVARTTLHAVIHYAGPVVYSTTTKEKVGQLSIKH
jgi:hypothetical protein